jgi:hypothetical protein
MIPRIFRPALLASRSTSHLLFLGHRDIMLLASEARLRTIQERIEGDREALREAGISDLENTGDRLGPSFKMIPLNLNSVTTKTWKHYYFR